MSSAAAPRRWPARLRVGPTRFRLIDIAVLAAAAFLLVQAPLSVVEAGWVINLDPLPRLAVAGLLVGYLLERIRLPGALGLPLGALIGVEAIIYVYAQVGIGGSLGKPALVTGEQTTFGVTVQFNADSIPDSVWQNGGGISPELVNPTEIQKAAPDIHIPRAGEQGGVLLVVSNGSPGVVKFNEVVRVLHKQDFKNNQFTTGGGVQSLRSGGFVLNLLAANLFKPIPGREVPANLSENQKLPQNRMNPQLLATSAPAYDPDDPGNKEVKEGDPLNPTTGDDRDFDENAVPYKIVTENDKKKPCPCPPPTLKKENNGKTYIVCAVSAECKANCGGICRLYYAVRKPDLQKPKEKPKWKGGEATGKKEKDDSSVYTCACSTNK